MRILDFKKNVKAKDKKNASPATPYDKSLAGFDLFEMCGFLMSQKNGDVKGLEEYAKERAELLTQTKAIGFERKLTRKCQEPVIRGFNSEVHHLTQ